ncbi:uncharacterized protein M6B38_309740 [Iris pallida]|uniref:DUF7792 domain-containing protein n=1 Tax=Iris pallida TaxID=29817 RepID=A0AAX6HIX3_IRIPA|nr:uncharacterized protein M6B38_309740 [Iris pallida]
MMGDGVKNVLTRPLQLADQVTKWADDAQSFKQECQELKSKTEKLSALLRQAARVDLYERPTRRIMDDTEQVLDKALALVSKCRAAGLVKRLFTIIPAAAFKKMSTHLDNSLGDVSWLLRVSAGGDDDGDMHLGLPPIAQNEPILFLIWEQIATLHTGTPDSRADAAASLVSLARGNDRYGKLIIEEDGVGPLLRLVKDGQLEGQENAARAVGLLGRDPESVEQMVLSGVCSVFAKALKEGPMRVQAMAAWAVSELAANHPKCQDAFAQNNVIRLLVSHLAFETVQEHSKYTIPPKATSIHSVVMASSTAAAAPAPSSAAAPAADATTEQQLLVKHPLRDDANKNKMHSVVQLTMAARSPSKPPPLPTNNNSTSSSSSNNGGKQQNSHQNHQHLSGASIKGREFEDPATKANMKAMAAKALWQLAKGNAGVCKSITDSKALLCFAVLLEKGADEVRYNSVMALMEIARVAERETELRRLAFKPNSPAAKAVVDQLVRIVEKADYDDLLVPCIVALGCLSRTFRATETRVIGPLVRLLDDREPAVSKEAAVALTKFACAENYLHMDHCRSIIEYGGVKHLVQLVYLGEPVVQTAALVLLCFIAYHVPESEPLSHSEVGNVLEWASKQGYVVQDPLLDTLLPEAKGRVELYNSKSTMGYH